MIASDPNICNRSAILSSSAAQSAFTSILNNAKLISPDPAGGSDPEWTNTDPGNAGILAIPLLNPAG